jgi:PLAC8 family
MDEGYTFMVTANDANGDEDIIPVTVPPGGIRQGQIFYSTSRSFANNSRTQSFSSCSTTLKIGSISSNISEWTPLAHQRSSHELTFGQWKDRWFDCCRLGFCHVTIWNAFCCPQILAAQILTRLKLNWLGDPMHEGNPHQRKAPGKTTQATFHHVLLMVILYWCLSTLTDPHHLPGPTSLIFYEGILFNESNEQQQRDDNYILYNVINVLFGVYTFLLLTKLRYQTRRAHRIPPSNPWDILIGYCTGGKISDIQDVNTSYADDNGACVDDCCMAVFCGCCSVAQMARQTAAYHSCSCDDELSSMDHQYEHAVCCSINGLPRQTV